MLNTTSTQTPVVNNPSTPQQSYLSSSNPSSQSNQAFSPYWTPIALYYLEREAEWARG